MAVAAYVIFFIAGLGFGYAAPGVWKWLPLAAPLILFVFAVLAEGVSGTAVLRLVIALVVTAAGVLLGSWLDRREAGDREARLA